MRITKYLLIVLMLVCGLGQMNSFAKEEKVYVTEEKGRSTIRTLFDKKMKTPAEQWEYASKTQEKGRLKRADRRFLYLVRRWPNSKEAPWAARARADILHAIGKPADAFDAYQFLIDNYSSRMRDYDSVLENQFDIAIKIMNRRRMRWIFGGYRAPEYAITYFEKVIRNGPQWKKAPEAQMLIGKCYQESKDLEMAISAYDVLGYRYPDTEFAEDAAWRQILCLELLREEFPNNLATLDRLLTATTVFLTIHMDSSHRTEIITLRNTIYEVKATRGFEEAEFYENVSKKASAAIIYYDTMIEEFPKSQLVPTAEERVVELRRLLDMPRGGAESAVVRSRPLPFTKERKVDAAQ